MRRTWHRTAIPALALLLAGCAGIEGIAVPTGRPAPTARRPAPAPAPAARRADAQDVARLSRVMIPLLRVANKPRPLDQVRVGLLADDAINAANAGSGEFYVTRGLLDRANDEQLAAVLAHEVAHDDLNHVGKTQALGAGLGIGAVILDQIFPGVGQVAPVAGTLITRAYTRREELEADRHGVEILRRAGLPPEAMEQTLIWLRGETGGGTGGGFFSTHPGTDERIAALRRMR